jgi:CheY-like chemotaxis protein
MSQASPPAARVLIADDSLMHRNFLRAALLKCEPNLEIVDAEDGDSCLHELTTKPYDLVFIDLVMPGKSGLEACGLAFEGKRPPYMVMVSNNAEPAAIEQAKTLKVCDYLRKPYHERDVQPIYETFVRVKTPMRGLIIDDSATVRRVICKVLASSIFSIEIEEAGGGLEGFQKFNEQLNEHPFDLAIIDINMPDLDGCATARMIRSRNSGAKIVLTSSDKGAIDRARAAKAPFDALLTKPFRGPDIDAMLHTLYGLKTPYEAVGATARA